MGKKTRSRACPAAGREITAAECGSGRHTTYACPEECPFNPFSAANYDQFSRIENGAEKRFLEWILANAPDRAQIALELERAVGSGPNVRLFHCLSWHGVFRTDPDGQTCIGKWAKAGFPGLTADERTCMRGRSQMRPAIIEVHRVLDSRRTEVVDLLDAEKRPILVVDRSFAMQAVRFGVYGLNIIPLPNYWRLAGVGTSIPDLQPLEVEEVIREIIRHLGGGADEPAMRSFLKEHFQRFEDSLTAVALARREAMLEQLDAQFGRRNYRLILPYSQCRARLDSSPDVAPDSVPDSEQAEGFIEGRAWYARPADPDVERAAPHATLGRVLLSPGRWRLQALGAEKLGRLRQRFDALMAGAVRFTSQRRTDLAAPLREDFPGYDPALVPPALLRDPQKVLLTVSRPPVPDEPATPEETMADWMRQRDRGFLDGPLPGLDGKTPRQAVSDPACRQKLVRMMKSRIRGEDERNLETGSNVDVNWMVRELGLDEILFEPPPPRPRLGPGSAHSLMTG